MLKLGRMEEIAKREFYSRTVRDEKKGRPRKRWKEEV